MRVRLHEDGVARYTWLYTKSAKDSQKGVEPESLDLNSLLGKRVQLRFGGNIECIYCGRATKKSFSQGYCYPCFIKLARCDLCVVRPHTCHYDKGTCREPEWGLSHCMQQHTVYLAETSALKVGLTRNEQIPTRWIDQGAIQALPIMQTSSRKTAGMVEMLCASKAAIKDTTNWRAMLTSAHADIDLFDAEQRLLAEVEADLQDMHSAEGSVVSLRDTAESRMVKIDYPVLRYPEKVSSVNLDKTPEINGYLQGIKGQYLIIDDAVLNIRKFAGYCVDLLSE